MSIRTDNELNAVRTSENDECDDYYTGYQETTEFELIQNTNNLLHILKSNANKLCRKHHKRETACKGCPCRILLNFGLKNGKQAKFPYCLNYIARIAQKRLNDDFYPKTGESDDAANRRNE